MDFKFGFIGIGNMGGALARAACVYTMPAQVILTDLDEAKVRALSGDLNCAFGKINEVAERSRYIFLGAKPQGMPVLLDGIKDTLAARRDRFVLVSMAAGLTVSKIREFSGGDYPIIRIMPNIPASVGEGMILYTAGEGVLEDEISEFVDGMRGAGRFDRLSENLMDAGSAISGCGPAFVYMFIEALADGGVECGLPYDKALEYAAGTVAGAARMVLESGTHPEALKNAVCSPAGSTIAGVRTLENGAFRGLVMNAVTAAFKRTQELGK